jgi:ribosomal protein S4
MKRRLILDKFFFNTIVFLELRLSTLVFRMFFLSNFFEINKEIHLGNITVNNKKKHRNFLVRIGSIVKHRLNKKENISIRELTEINVTRLCGWR